MSLAWQLATTVAGATGGAPGQVLTTDGAANLRWGTVSGGPPPTGGAPVVGGGGGAVTGGGGAPVTGGGAGAARAVDDRIAELEARLAALEESK